MNVAVHNLIKTFGTLRANDQISLEFAAGQIHGVLGENGAGKSTLMKMLSGFLRADGGTILLDDKPVTLGTPIAALRAGVGMVHQDPLDVPAFSVLENFFCASPRRALPTRAAARRMLVEFAQRLGFALEPDAPVASLTVGQRQQLEITRLLACGAQVFILDEPTTGISAAQATALFAALRRLASEGKTVLFVSHKLNEVEALCDTVSVLRAGQVVGAGQMAMPQSQQQIVAMMFGPQSTQDHVPPMSAPQTTAPVWHLDSVTVREGRLNLNDVTLTISGGSILGLAGLEGSGQQLFMQTLAGQMRPVAGRVSLGGDDVTYAGAATFRRAGVSYLPADRLAEGMVGALSLTDHIALQQRGVLLDQRMATTAAAAAIADYNIKATPTTPIAALSGGNQQRAMLALLPEHCRGLLCDQPTRGLDVESARAVWQRLVARSASGTAIVFASADLDELLDYSDHVLVFFGGAVSRPLARAELDAARLAELIGGVGFEAVQ